MVAKKKAVKKKTAKKKTVVKRASPNTMPQPVKNPANMISKNPYKNTTQFDILYGIPIPWTRIRIKEIIFPFEGMRVGESFQFMREFGRSQNVYSATGSYCRQPENFHKKFVVRKITEFMDRGVKWIKWGCWREEDLTKAEVEEKQQKLINKRETIKQNR